MKGLDGLLVIDKPGGQTSRAVVNLVQRWFPTRTKVGHCGTLDPLATGVLVVCVGQATRLADYVQQQGKTYHARIRLGAVSTTDDADGQIREQKVAAVPTAEEIAAVLRGFVGTIWQRPPTVSAVKLHGQRAYTLARQGAAPELTPRPVSIQAIRLLDYRWPTLELEVDCGKGTYIRSLARDVGEKLGCGGYVDALRRLRIGPFTLQQAVPLVNRTEPPPLLPLELAVAHLPRLELTADQAERFSHGQPLAWPTKLPEGHRGATSTPPDENHWAVVDPQGFLIGIGERHGRWVRPRVVLSRQRPR
ncbi:MAG: tRNA pseudouridine(55) synthase TruB [Gemmataceae bacterium]|nr:tRNA pseudouridine(55) synthase TruB [Gemmataceae bacterium]